jgi:putative transposase
MISPDEQSLLRLFSQLLPTAAWEELEGQDPTKGKSRKKRSDRVYSLPVVMAMMLVQRLDPEATQQEAVNKLVQGQLDGLLPGLQGRGQELSSNTGSYAGACGRVRLEVIEKAADKLLRELGRLMEPVAELARPVLVWDGTSFTLEHTPDVLKQFPPSRNQHGEAHWGMVRVVVIHDVRTGIGQRIHWGKMYGPEAVSEQQLAVQALEQTSEDAILLGDGNFGVFYLAYQAAQKNRGLIFRLTAQRAKSMGATALLPYGEWKKTWKPTRKDREKHRDLAPEAQVEGRLIAVQCPGFRQPVYLFTTLPDDIEKIVGWYGLRWNIEVDLRSLKRTMHLHHIRAKSAAAVQKEMLIATVAYGMVRAFMVLAARRAGSAPRQLSFTRAYSMLDGMLRNLCSVDPKERERGMDRLLYYIAQAKLPNRSKARSYPRAVWGHRQSFPPMETVRKGEADR